MEKSLLLRKSVFWLVLIYILAPLIHIFSYYSWSGWHGWDSFLHKVLTGAFIQALLSTFLTLFFGTLGAFGLLSRHSGKQAPGLSRFIIFLLLTPCLLPALFVILLAFKATGFLPTGLWGVVWFHCLMNVGLSSLLLSQNYGKKKLLSSTHSVLSTGFHPLNSSQGGFCPSCGPIF